MGNLLSLSEDKKLELTGELVTAAMEGKVEEMLAMLSIGQPCHSVDRFGLTALHWAAYHGQLGAVKCLIESGSNPHQYDTNGRSALHHACHMNRMSVAKFLLIQCRVNIDSTSVNGDTPLHKAVRSKHIEMVRLLLEGGANPNVKNAENYTPLDLTTSMNGGIREKSKSPRGAASNSSSTEANARKTIPKVVTMKTAATGAKSGVGIKGFRSATSKLIVFNKLNVSTEPGNKEDEDGLNELLQEILRQHGGQSVNRL